MWFTQQFLCELAINQIKRPDQKTNLFFRLGNLQTFLVITKCSPNLVTMKPILILIICIRLAKCTECVIFFLTPFHSHSKMFWFFFLCLCCVFNLICKCSAIEINYFFNNNQLLTHVLTYVFFYYFELFFFWFMIIILINYKLIFFFVLS
jgi:hypothetical protein